MKIILSHDIDHLHWSEHYFRDTYVPKLFVRTAIQRFRGLIDTRTALERINIFKENRLNRLDELITFLKNENIKSTFFIGFANGLNLSYSSKEALSIGKYLQSHGFAIGVHGIEYQNVKGIKSEKKIAESLLLKQYFSGIRMHYLRKSNNMHSILEDAGYHYDSTEYRIADPYLIKPGLWSFPIGVMDCYAVTPERENLEMGKEYTLKLIEQALYNNLNYFVINFHDLYFNDKGYKNYKEWLIWLVHHLKNDGHTFTDFETAIVELKKLNKNK